MTNLHDIMLVCRDCGKEFAFTVGEQEFYSQKGFLHTPVRCPECRQARKKARGNGNRPAKRVPDEKSGNQAAR